MEGGSVHSRPWSLFVRLFPAPLRWVGTEIVRLIHWIDHRAARMVGDLRSSPAFFFVSVAGVTTVGLTIGLFASLMVPNSGEAHLGTVHRSAVRHGRFELEKNHDWSTQDRWRVAHLFVPHKPPVTHRDIQIDSRLNGFSADDNFESAREPVARAKDFEVRLENNRPRKAELDSRIVDGGIGDARRDRFASLSSLDRSHRAHYRVRDPRLHVQATWDFDVCRPYGSSSLPVAMYSEPNRRTPFRRTRPVEPEAPTTPARWNQPDLAFTMQLFRQPSLPPQSRLVVQSERSRFPVDDELLRQYSGQVIQNWQLTEDRSRHSLRGAVQYAGMRQHDSQSEQDSFSEEDLNLPASAEVELRIEFITPRAAAGGETVRSTVIVSNQGHKTVPRIELKEAVDQFLAIVEASPDAAIETVASHDSKRMYLHRHVNGLAAGDEREFTLAWIPEGVHRQIHRADVIAYAVVAATTEISRPEPAPSELPEPERHPSLACDVQCRDKVNVGDQFDLEIVVRNTGDVPLHNVDVRVEIPEQFVHAVGNDVVVIVGDLPVRGRNRAVIRLLAKRAGDVVSQIRVVSIERVEAHGTAKTVVVDRVPTPATPPQVAVLPKPRLVPEVENQQVARTNGCFCQQASANTIKPKNLIP